MSDVQPTINPPIMRRLWIVILLTCLIIPFFVAMIILLSGPVYRWRETGWQPIGNSARYAYGGLLALWFVAVVGRAVLMPISISQEWDKSANPDQHTSQAAASANTPDTCEGTDATDMVKRAIEQGASKLIERKVLDYGHAQELYFDKAHNTRYCQADAELNTGSGPISFKLYFGPSGSELVQVQEGPDAYDTKDMATLAEAQKSSSQPPQQNTDASVASSQTASNAIPPPAANPPSNTKDPLDARYSTDYKTCMSSGDAGNGVTSAMVDCTDAELKVQDAKLNTTYKSAMSSLATDKQSTLRNAQRAWIKFRDNKCDSENQSGGTMDEIGKPDCILQMTIRRTIELENIQP